MRWTALAACALGFGAGCGLMTAGEPPARTEAGAPPPPAAGPSPADPAGSGDVTHPLLPGYRLVFADEFDGTAIDERKWAIAEEPYIDAILSRDAVTVANGVARLTTYTDASGVHHSGYISTGDRFFSYGYFEARVRLWDSSGGWCSFFLFPDTYRAAPGDPATAGVELDVFEHRFADESGWKLADYVQVGVNWNGVGGKWEKSHQTLALPDGSRIQGQWHTFAVLWTPSGYEFYADDRLLWTPQAPPTAHAMPVKLTCMVMDNSWAGPVPAGGYGSRATSTTGMEIDWVRIWQLP